MSLMYSEIAIMLIDTKNNTKRQVTVLNKTAIIKTPTFTGTMNTEKEKNYKLSVYDKQNLKDQSYWQ